MQNMKQLMKIKLLIFSLIIAIGISGCLINSKYHKANDLYNQGNYVNAINVYDEFIENNPNSPFATQARLERSQCYFALGERAYSKENWLLAKRLFLLANSAKADSLLDNCFYNIGLNQLTKEDTLAALENFGYIVNNLKNSELLPEILFKRIELNYELQNYSHITSDYKYLWNNYPDSKYASQAIPYIDKILPDYLAEIEAMVSEKKYDEAIANLQQLLAFPSSLQDEIKSLMAKTYFLKADSAFQDEKLQIAKQNFDNSAELTSQYKTKTKQRIDSICQSYLEEGNRLVNLEKFDQAIAVFKKIYVLDPQNKQVDRKISETEELKNRKSQAQELLTEALEKENNDEYEQALQLYKQSNNLYSSKEAKQKIFEISNILRADKEPKVFAKDIIFAYNDGELVKNVYALQDSLIIKHGKDEVRTSEWKVLYSFGKYKYEVRYDILTPGENYYFIWQVDLLKQKVSPLNKLSEEVL
jgi:tetratricopeptide (TPR) repeat protein